MTDILDDLLDTTLDDIADLPSFAPFPAGTHRVLATFEQKEIASKPCIELSFKMLENIELANPEDVKPNEGDSCSALNFLTKVDKESGQTVTNDFGLGSVKAQAASFQESLGLTTLRDVVDGVKDVECLIVTSLRKNKDNPDRPYLDIKQIAVV